jgi:maltooligosyltrehalose trehalohydrolase
VLVTGEQDGYYAAYAPTVGELARTIEQGWLYEGEVYAPWKAPRGRPAPDLTASRFVYSVQNHDQIGNRPLGTRLHHDAGVEAHAAAVVLLLFLPMVPLLFMGEEWAASSPFLYFTDHEAELGRAITRGRHDEFAHFRGFADPAVRDHIPDPQARATFERSRLDWEERTREPHAGVLDLYRRMLRLRASDVVLSAPSRARLACETKGSLLVVRRWVGTEERVLFFNAGTSPVATPFAFGEDDLLVASAPLGHPGEIPARSAVVVRRSPSSVVGERIGEVLVRL